MIKVTVIAGDFFIINQDKCRTTDSHCSDEMWIGEKGREDSMSKMVKYWKKSGNH